MAEFQVIYTACGDISRRLDKYTGPPQMLSVVQESSASEEMVGSRLLGRHDIRGITGLENRSHSRAADAA
ncbi:hypothetical protein N0V85_004220 [Neurospora sp. IMI 360204]|nr:hypothetical protein N0V85_004220 [Neurospora sp. IMI 360204]